MSKDADDDTSFLPEDTTTTNPDDDDDGISPVVRALIKRYFPFQ
jgi:hypothetical protein